MISEAFMAEAITHSGTIRYGSAFILGVFGPLLEVSATVISLLGST
jgi:hypothetical protein